MLLVIGADERVVSVNRRGCEILGLPAPEIAGKNWFDSFVPESGRKRVREIFRTVMAGALGAAEYVENTVLTARERFTNKVGIFI
jgi:PAS domain S-box-containing protein